MGLALWGGSPGLSGIGAVTPGTTPIVGGTDKRVLFDDNGVIGEDSGLAYDKTLGVLTLGGKTVTTSNPPLSITQTWNAGAVVFTGIKLNITDTASSGSSQLIDLQVGGATKVSISKLGTIATVTGVSAYGTGNSSGFSALTDTSPAFRLGASSDVVLTRDAANTLALRNGTAAQIFNIYNTYTDASNYQRLTHKWNTTTSIIQNEGIGTSTNGNIAFGNAALATSATKGYVMIPTSAGAPTGVPADIPTGQVALHYDSTNNKIYVYNGAWKSTIALL